MENDWLACVSDPSSSPMTGSQQASHTSPAGKRTARSGAIGREMNFDAAIGIDHYWPGPDLRCGEGRNDAWLLNILAENHHDGAFEPNASAD